MRRGQKRTQFGRRAVTKGALVLASVLCGHQQLRAQSDAILEDQILQGLAPPTGIDLGGYASPGAPPGADKTLLVDPPQLREERREQRETLQDEILEVDESIQGPRSVPRDHILVVQYRFIRKAGTHELTPIHLGIQPADSFRKQFGWGFSYAYHITEDIGIEVLDANFYKNFETKTSEHIFKETNLITDRKEPVFSLGSSFLWTPLKSKAAAREDVWYFEGYFSLGGGFSKFEDRNVGLMTLGVGFRAYLTQNALYKVELRDSLDFRGGSPWQRLNAVIGASLLLGGSP